MHEIADLRESKAEAAAGMELAKQRGREFAEFHQRYRQRIPDRKCHARGGRRHDAYAASFFGGRQHDRDIRLGLQCASRFPDDRRQGQPEPTCVSDQVRQFRRFAGIGKSEHGIRGSEHPEIAVACLCRVDVMRRRSRRRERRRDFSGDMPGFSDPGNDYAAFRAIQELDRVAEASPD